MQVSIVVPVFNEAQNLEPLIREIHAALATGPAFELLYVDDGSADGSAHQLAGLQREFAQLRVLRHAGRFGQSAAIYSGVKAARAPWVVTLDGDGQNDPADILTLLEARATLGLQPPCLLTGWRQRRRDSGLRRLSSRLANGLRAWMLQDHTPDTGCGLKLFPRDLFLALPAFNHMHRFLPALVLRAGGEVHSVPVGHRPRGQGKSKYGVHNRLWVGLVDLFGVRWLQRRALPYPAVEQGVEPREPAS